MTIVFLHGAGCTGRVFEHQMRAFEDCFTPDLPGHLTPGAPQSIREFADWIEHFVSEKRLQKVVLCGHSMGAAVALDAALRRPDWLSGAVLLGGGAKMRVAPAILQRLETDFDEGARYLAGFFFADGSDARTEWAVESMRSVGSAQTIRDFRACDAFDVLDRLPEVSIPLLALTGESDKMTPPKYAQALADRVPGAQARMVSGAGHFVMVEKPQETNDAVRAFISGNA